MTPQFSRDLTNSDLSSHMGPVGAKSGLNIAFFWTRLRVQSVDPEKNGQLVNRLCVAKQPKGDPKTIVHRYTSPEEASRLWPREYALFTQFEDVPAQGTPLSELPGISRSQILQLELVGLRCVEDLQEISDDQAAQHGMEVSRARKVALKWLATREDGKGVIEAADSETKALAALRTMEQRLARLEQHNIRLQAENDALSRAGGGQSRTSSPQPLPQAEAEDVPYELDDSDGFLAGGDIATGGDDLGDTDPDPLAE
ncbi:hypothetical protein [Salipiger marinus]|uniref:Uncharacterized protein n=1 Tax=Salipiger marinus TaxID=555512 RepID=A0A1G8MQW3_9RHOB|nr:hypothetical protein [Salipiger marinus]SDI70439.1 hypothetical protein SAMN04487993_1008219 [Salipiger marinus]